MKANKKIIRSGSSDEEYHSDKDGSDSKDHKLKDKAVDLLQSQISCDNEHEEIEFSFTEKQADLFNQILYQDLIEKNINQWVKLDADRQSFKLYATCKTSKIINQAIEEKIAEYKEMSDKRAAEEKLAEARLIQDKLVQLRLKQEEEEKKGKEKHSKKKDKKKEVKIIELKPVLLKESPAIRLDKDRQTLDDFLSKDKKVKKYLDELRDLCEKRFQNSGKGSAISIKIRLQNEEDSSSIKMSSGTS